METGERDRDITGTGVIEVGNMKWKWHRKTKETECQMCSIFVVIEQIKQTALIYDYTKQKYYCMLLSCFLGTIPYFFQTCTKVFLCSNSSWFVIFIFKKKCSSQSNKVLSYIVPHWISFFFPPRKYVILQKWIGVAKPPQNKIDFPQHHLKCNGCFSASLSCGHAPIYFSLQAYLISS